MNEIIFIGVAASVMGDGAYWHGGIAALKMVGDTPLGSSPYATIPGMSEILALGENEKDWQPVHSFGWSFQLDFFILCPWDNYFMSRPGKVARYVYSGCA